MLYRLLILAGNCKLNKQEKDRDKEQEDEFGYTMGKTQLKPLKT